MRIDVPDWCRWRAGGGPLIVVAPHGGARRTTRQRAATDKVNDLHTADVAAELAAALDAGLIVNATVDRNDLDLNRLSQVRARAPWFLALLESLLADAIAQHGRAELLIVHGWNTTAAKCDLGIGQRLSDADDDAAHATALTVSPHYVATRLADLRAACAVAGIDTPLGERYPARHPNNVLQLFRRGAAHPAASPRLAGWVAAGCIEAVQLELSVPLRWPGRMRGAFIAALIATCADDVPAGGRPRVGAGWIGPGRPVATGAHGGAPSSGPARDVVALESARAGAVQAYDRAAGLGLTARVELGAHGAATSRVLLFRGGREVALYTGETAEGTRPAGGPRFLPEAGGFRLCFEGHLLATDDGRLYVDLESALAASRLLAVHIDLHFATLRDDYGRIRGEVAIDGQPLTLDACGFARPGALQGAGGGRWQSQFSLHAAFTPDRALRVRHAVPGATTLQELRSAVPRPIAPLAVVFDGDPYTPHHVAVGTDLVAEPISRMAIQRPLGPGRVARVTFGVARVVHAGAVGFGFYEYARVL